MAFTTAGSCSIATRCGFLVAERGDVHLVLQLVLDPLVILGELGFGELHVVLQQELVEFVDQLSSGSQPLGSLVSSRAEVLRGEVEERVLAQQLDLELVQLGRRRIFRRA